MDSRTIETLTEVWWAVAPGLVWCLLGFAAGCIVGPAVLAGRQRRAGKPTATGSSGPGATVMRGDRAGRPALVQPGDVRGSGYLPARPVPLVRDRGVAPLVLDVPTARLRSVGDRATGGQR